MGSNIDKEVGDVPQMCAVVQDAKNQYNGPGKNQQVAP